MGIIKESKEIKGQTQKLLKTDVNSFKIVRLNGDVETFSRKDLAVERYDYLLGIEFDSFLDYKMSQEVERDNRRKEFNY